ncbi:Fic family protein [Ancylobacter sp. WKF20]|uniref:type II toxin-antitoxin system death-on-curing family toxin n=1 Tax=Ancylobacter sp. WKF20 TaxID=3039801 RepID=UPI002434321D|nr:Fic family protein [Ancylobacter sp. WKF20]WGD30226.1 Fic family protein [Ancylobacter sp. WKF20]
MPPERLWLEIAQIEDIARAVVESSGEPYLLRDEGLLESAVMAPRQRWHYGAGDDPAALGLHLALAIARNHPFEQGNKRAAWFSMLAFFALNGLALKNEDDPALADQFVAVITGEFAADDLLSRLDVTRL